MEFNDVLVRCKYGKNRVTTSKEEHWLSLLIRTYSCLWTPEKFNHYLDNSPYGTKESKTVLKMLYKLEYSKAENHKGIKAEDSSYYSV